jgi:hypothetical protein
MNQPEGPVALGARLSELNLSDGLYGSRRWRVTEMATEMAH